MQKQLLVIFTILLALIAATYFGLRENDVVINENGKSNTSLLSEHLDLTKLNSIRIANAENTLLHAENTNNVWMAHHLNSKNTYPIDKSLLSTFVQKLASANLIQAKSGLPENHHRLHLLDVENSESKAILVDLVFSNGNAKILLGKAANLQAGQYVRYQGNNQMWLQDQQLIPPSDKYVWLQTGIFSVSENEIVSIKRVGDKEEWTINREETEDDLTNDSEKMRSDKGIFVLDGFDVGKDELRYDSVISDYVTNMLNVDFKSVRAYSESSWEQNDKKIRFELLDTLRQTHTLELIQSDDISLIHLTTFGEQSYVQDWVYEISNYQAREMAKVYSDFLVESAGQDTE